VDWTGKIKRTYHHRLPATVFIATIVWAVCVRVFELQTPIGAHIAALAFLVAIVTIWLPETQLAKAFWVLTFFALTFLEINGLYKDSRELAEARAKENESFKNLLKREEEIVGQLTGDGAFAYLEMLIIPVDVNGASLAATVEGDYVIRQVNYNLIEGRPPYKPSPQALNDLLAGRNVNTVIGDIAPHLITTINRVVHPPLDQEGFYTLNIFALNGHLTETIETRYERMPSPHWNRRITVKRDGKPDFIKDWYAPR
jgi:hypothetical protein